MNTKQRESIDKMINVLMKAYAKLSTGGIPSREETTRWFAMATTTRGCSAEYACRFLSRPRKSDGSEGEALHERLRWHGLIPGSTGNLWGPMISSHKVDRDLWDRMDTFAAVLGHLMGCRSHSERWARELGSPRTI